MAITNILTVPSCKEYAHDEFTLNIKYTGNKIGKMAECELRQRKKEGDDGNKLQESNEEVKSIGSDQVLIENKSELVRLISI